MTTTARTVDVAMTVWTLMEINESFKSEKTYIYIY